MSYETIYKATVDEPLRQRTEAGVSKEALNNPTYGNTDFGQLVKKGQAGIWQQFAYPIAVATEAAYESAIIGGNDNPGGDPSVITDAALLSAIQATWPPN